MIVILTEKPSAAKNFAKALGGNQGKYNGEAYEIVASCGHLFEFVKPEQQVQKDLAEKYRTWNLENIPWNLEDISWKKQKKQGAFQTIETIRDALKNATELIIATDVDPSGEGELLAWEILEYCRWNGKTSRMYFMDEAESSIQKAFNERKVLKGMMLDGDYVKADTRSKWDYLSMQITRIASCTARRKGYSKIIRQGRLKSVMVYLVGKQLEDIKNYKKTPFYEVRFKDENGNVFKRAEGENNRFSDKSKVDIDTYKSSDIVIDSVEKKSKVPGKLLNLAALSSILAEQGYKPQNILATYQKMYENQIVSYPRTEDKEVTLEQFQELLPYIDNIAAVVNIDKSLITHRAPRQTHVKNGGAHGANRPGINVPASLDDLMEYGKEAKAIYITVAKNYLAMLCADYEYEQQKGHLSDYIEFKAISNIPISLGYKSIFDSDVQSKDAEEKDETNKHLGNIGIPYIHEGANPKPQKPTMKWLTHKLEKSDVGTGATRTSTLADITNSKDEKALMIEQKGTLTLSEYGEISYILLDGCKIASADVTEQLFKDMKKIGKFDLEPTILLKGINEIIMHDMKQMVLNSEKLKVGAKSQNNVIGVCPKCGANVMSINGKYGTFYGCGIKECNFSIPGKLANKKISESIAAQLLEKGETKKLKGFVSKKGKSFEAKLKIKDDYSGLEFVFEK